LNNFSGANGSEPRAGLIVIDCDHLGQAQGCNGDRPEDGMAYIQANGVTAYPYTAKNGVCKKATAVVKISGFVQSLPAGNDTALLSMLQRGPVSVVIYGGPGTWMDFYTGGIVPALSPCCWWATAPILVLKSLSGD
jgi:hypothetical protein